jgi:aconitate hydratase
MVSNLHLLTVLRPGTNCLPAPSTSGTESIKSRKQLTLTIHRPDGSSEEVPVLCRIDTADEVAYYKNGGILHYVLRNLMKAA